MSLEDHRHGQPFPTDGLAVARQRQYSQYENFFRIMKARGPFTDQVWGSLMVAVRAEEELQDAPQSFYSHVPANEMIAVGSRLRSASSEADRYRILTGYCSTGEQWYDIVLGHVNSKQLAPVVSSLAREFGAKGLRAKVGLDVGCGTGNSLRAVAPYFEKMIGVDRLDFTLESMRRRPDFPANADLRVGDATALPVEDGTVDVVINNGMSGYLFREEMIAYISEVDRVLKCGGSYFEPFFLPAEEGALLPPDEVEYLTNAKGLMMWIMDRVCTGGPVKDEWSPQEMVDEFKRREYHFEISGYDSLGAYFVVFVKP